jgi:hypothetical protein
MLLAFRITVERVLTLIVDAMMLDMPALQAKIFEAVNVEVKIEDVWREELKRNGTNKLD